MNYVEPIRDPAAVEDIALYLKKNSERNYIMFRLGIYSGLRISDILRLKVKDVSNKSYINIREKKTGKQKLFPINPTLKNELKNYCSLKEGNDYLINSREGMNKSITRKQAYNIIRKAGEAFGMYNLGTHTMRKTFGYHFYIKYKDVVMLQKIFNHSDPSITLKYIGIEQGEMDKKMRNLRIY